MITFGTLTSGNYFVVRRFGKNRLYEVKSVSRNGTWLGWRVQAREMAMGYDFVCNYLLMPVRPLTEPRGRLIFAASYYIWSWRVLDVLVGKPRMHFFRTSDEALKHMDEHPSVSVGNVVLRNLAKVLPHSTLVALLMVTMLIRDTFVPFASWQRFDC